MTHVLKSALLALLLSTFAVPVMAANYAKQAAQAASTKLDAITIFVDSTLGMRKDSAARELTEAHVAFAAQGFAVVDVVGYTENGDLQGFFVTYRKR